MNRVHILALALFVAAVIAAAFAADLHLATQGAHP